MDQASNAKPNRAAADLLEFVESKVQRGESASVSDYVVALVDAARDKRSDIEAALIEGLESRPVEEWTGQDWENMKQRVTQRHQASQG